MNLLKKENWLTCLILSILSEGLFTFVLSYFLKLYDENAWYTKWQYWVFGTVCLVFPAFIMLYVFLIQMACKVASKLEVPGENIYNTPYTWILCLVVPVIGWIFLIVMCIYIFIWPNVMLKKGKGEV